MGRLGLFVASWRSRRRGALGGLVRGTDRSIVAALGIAVTALATTAVLATETPSPRGGRGADEVAGRLESKLSRDLRAQLDARRPAPGAPQPDASEDLVRVIVQTDEQTLGATPAPMRDFLARPGVRLQHRMKSLGLRVVEIPLSQVSDLAEMDDVRYVSLDRDVRMLGHVSVTTGADLVRQLSNSGPGSLSSGSGSRSSGSGSS